MRVDIDESVFVGEGVLEIVALVTLATQHDHVVVADVDVVDQWCGSLETIGADVQKLLHVHLERVSTLTARTRRIVVESRVDSDWDTGTLTVRDALGLLRAPLELFLENEEADWFFVRRLATPTQRVLLDDAMGRGALQVRHGGGVPGITAGVRQMFEQSDRPGLQRQRELRRRRTWVLIDRDAHPHDRSKPSEQTDRAVEECERHASDPWVLHYHRLCRRHIESYLPDAVLREYCAHPDLDTAQRALMVARFRALAALRQSDPEAADSVHMKGGLLKDVDADDAARNDAGAPAKATRVRAQAVLSYGAPFDRVDGEVRADLLRGTDGLATLFRTAGPEHDRAFRAEFDAREIGWTALELVESILECV